mgnify:CR=1 FL=1
MKQYFKISNGGIHWTVAEGQRHIDNIEMGAFGAGYIITYGVGEGGNLSLSRYCVYPALRTIPNNTHASFQTEISADKLPRYCLNGKIPCEKAAWFEINGLLVAGSATEGGVGIEHMIYPSSSARCNIERVTVENPTQSPVMLEISQEPTIIHSYGRGTKGVYVVEVSHDAAKRVEIEPKGSYRFHIFYSARTADEPLKLPDGEAELKARRERVSQLTSPLSLETGDPVLDTMFRFAKIRAGESIFNTRGGLLHSPGGKAYYAATWCNDEVEYAGPWFGMMGDPVALSASMNAYRQYIPFMSDRYTRIPSSVIAEGADIWEGAGDRGDAAMYLYGASLFSLFSGRRDFAEELWPAIQWCAEYCDRRKSPEDVIMSESDELEGRIPTDGRVNLSTSSLCYGGLNLAAVLADEFGETGLGQEYRRRAASLETAIESYFGARLHGFDTYRYSRGFDSLRAWICLPVCMGIRTRLGGTLDAMLSGYLWTEDGMLSCERGKENASDTVWDRSTLYGFKSAFLAGEGNRIWEAFYGYCKKRLLGERVPYAVEAYPEGERRQLSAESALFCRIIPEGILGIAPEGLNRFSFTPCLPASVNRLYLRNIHAFGSIFDIFVEADSCRVEMGGKVIYSVKTGKRVTVCLK